MKSATGQILIIEDNRDDEELLLMSLNAAGVSHETLVKRDGAAAVDHLSRIENRLATVPVLILLDLKLPKLSGFEVLKAIRSHASTRLAPVLVMTSSSQEEDVARSYVLGANGYVSKPIDYTEHQKAVRLIADYWLGLNRAPQAKKST